MQAKKFNPDMLRLARDAREATQADLARMSGVTQALISKIENGLGQPSEDVIEKVATALRFPISFFLQEERAIGFPPFHFRKRVRLSKGDLARINASVNIRRQHVTKLLRSYEAIIEKPIPQYDLDHSGLMPEQVAARLREYWLLPRGPIDNIVNLIERAGGIVILAKFGTDLLDAVSFRSEGLPPLFFMNREVPGDRFRFSLAHELGHIVMHTIPGDDHDMEKQADRFAAAFLMPAADIRPYLQTVKINSLGRVKAYWKVSIKALIKRAHDLKLITDNYYKVLNIQYSKAYSLGEDLPLPVEQPSTVHAAVKHHMHELRYSQEDLASLLCLTEDDLRLAYLDSGVKLRLVKG
ncbi:MAG TPA: XRE family transcriptional regulator [Rhizomicrobium sp.]|nr:XRE family transcriptional regulator [Rhizomicrobium sp.]